MRTKQVAILTFVAALVGPLVVPFMIALAQGSDGLPINFLDITRDTLANPWALGVFVAAIMQLAGKMTIEWLRCGLGHFWLQVVRHMSDEEADAALAEWALHSPVYSLVIVGLCYLVAKCFALPALIPANAAFLAIKAWPIAHGTYELVKNGVKLGGGELRDVTVMGWKWAH